MLLDPSPDQEFLQETTSKFLDQYAPIDELRRRRDDPVGVDGSYWPAGAELGWVSLLVPEEHGGGTISGRGLVDLSLIAHEFGRHAAPGPLAAANVVAAALSYDGQDDDGQDEPGQDEPGRPERLKLLAGVMAGTSIVGWSPWATRRSGPYDQVVEIRPEGTDLVVDGVIRPVEWAARAGQFLVTGRTGDGLTQVVVPADAAGVTVSALRTVDLTRRFDTVRFSGTRVPSSAALGPVGGAAAAAERQLQLALVISSAETVGAMQAAFDMAVAWAFDRYSFGRPLASYQALKHRYADMKSWLDASHAITDAAVLAVENGAANAGELASAAKSFTGQFGTELMQDCVQMHGGIGVTFEHDLHLFLRRATLNRALYGTPEDHRQRIADILENAEIGKEGAAA